MASTFTAEAFAHLLADIGPRLEDVRAIAQEGGEAWTLAFEDDTFVLAEWVNNPVRVVLSASLGHPPTESRLTVLQALLSYNALWRDTDGVKAAQDGHNGELSLIYEWRLEELSGEEAVTVLENFAWMARWWNLYVSGVVSISGHPAMQLNEVSVRV